MSAVIYQERVLSFSKEMWDNFLKYVHILSRQSNIGTINITSCHIMDEGIKDLLSQAWARNATILHLSQSYADERKNNTITLLGDLLHGLPQPKSITLNDNSEEVLRNIFEPILLSEDFNRLRKIIRRLKDYNIFNHQSKLRTLILKDGGFSSLTRQLFMPLSDLISLDLSFDNITTLDSDVFQDLSNLQYLNIDSNQISELPETGLLYNMKSLNYFSIEQNNLTRVPVNIFEGAVNLTYLDIANNKLEYLPEDIFRTTKYLREIYLNNNQLTTLPKTLFWKLRDLNSLHLEKNKLTSIDE